MNEKKCVDEKSISRIFHRDCLLLAVFAVLMWCVLLFVLFSFLGLTSDPAVKRLMIAAACISGGTLSFGMLQVFFHIRANREEIYREDLENQALLKAESER